MRTGIRSFPSLTLPPPPKHQGGGQFPPYPSVCCTKPEADFFFSNEKRRVAVRLWFHTGLSPPDWDFYKQQYRLSLLNCETRRCVTFFFVCSRGRRRDFWVSPARSVGSRPPPLVCSVLGSERAPQLFFFDVSVDEPFVRAGRL